MAGQWTTANPSGCGDPVLFRVRMGVTFGPDHPAHGKLPLGVSNSPSVPKGTFATLEEAMAYVEGTARPNERNGERGDVIYWSEIVAWARRVRRRQGTSLGVITRAELPASTRLLAWRQPDGSLEWEETPRARRLTWEWFTPEDERRQSGPRRWMRLPRVRTRRTTQAVRR